MDNRRYRQIVFGEANDLTARIMRAVLRVASWPYGLAVAVRNGLYDRGWKSVHRAPVPVVSVGNITAGGTGKTPFVAYLANWFRSRNCQPCLLSRGYRAGQDAVNDEKRVLDQLCPGVPHLQNPDRVAAAERAVAEHPAQLLILDDGFQHRRLHRDLDVVLIDATDPWGAGALLPRGLLREPLRGLARADVLVITRCDHVTPRALETLESELRQCCPQTPVIRVSYPPQQLRDLTNRLVPLTELSGARVAAFCGIGNPEGFRTTLEQLGLSPVWLETFPDHHHYQLWELERLESRARADGVAAVLTTQKDLVKLTAPLSVPVWAVEIGTAIRSGQRELERRLSALTAARAPE